MRPPAPIASVSAYGTPRPGGITHWGTDIRGKAGDRVVAPEALTVTHVATDNTTAPLAGYGPGAILGRGASGLWHVLGHLDPATWSGPTVGRQYAEGEWLGNMAAIKGPHVHWEVRTVELPPRGPARGPLTLDPLAWLRGQVAPSGAVTTVAIGAALALFVLLYLEGRHARPRRR